MAAWTHPRIANPACRKDATDEIAAEARAAFQRRRDTYPHLVQAGQITADEARDDLEGWRAIAKDWHWITSGEGDPATSDTRDSRIASLDTAISRWFNQLDRNGGTPTEAESEQLALLCAMRWWAERENHRDPQAHIRFWAGIGHQYRQENSLPTLGAMRAARTSENERNAA